MATSFANVVNVLSTNEEFSLLFGTNQTWNLIEAEELTVELENRIMLTPHAAKRLSALLTARIAEFEQRCGKINI
ncbi:DUF3467 domain-containing protein [Methylobacterium durans]|uniref:DUF3467 domain-containing protein n=2 Tax=Methylobacterium durans TaxID=2202825 RepID=A0A2U8W8W9_9HYPH|nr:DUF3467 domain-containing protein [Methylobacterium durans]